MRSIMGLTPAHRGMVTWDGTNITQETTHRIARMGVGYVPEERRIFPGLTVNENLQIAARSSGDARWTEKTVYDLFPDLRLMANRPGGLLSGGQQQRVAAARALIGSPELVIADEPTSALDADSRDAFLKLLFDECEQMGSSLLFVSHDTSLATRFDRALSLAELNRASQPETF